MSKGLLYSILFHGFLVLYLAFGLPNFADKPKPIEHIVVDILPISEITNAKPKTPKAKPPAPVIKKAKPKKQKPKPPTPEPKKDIVQKPKKQVAKKVKIATPKKEKTKPKKQNKSPEPVKKAVLKDLSKPVAIAKPKNIVEVDKFDEIEDWADTIKIQQPKYNPDNPMSVSEKDALQGKIVELIHGNHHVLSGAKDAQKIHTKLFISINKSCIINNVKVIDVIADTNIASQAVIQAAESKAIRSAYAANFKGNLSDRECEYIFAESGIEANFYPDL